MSQSEDVARTSVFSRSDSRKKSSWLWSSACLPDGLPFGFRLFRFVVIRLFEGFTGSKHASGRWNRPTMCWYSVQLCRCWCIGCVASLACSSKRLSRHNSFTLLHFYFTLLYFAGPLRRAQHTETCIPIAPD